MNDNELFVERHRLAWFSTDLINHTVSGALTFRIVHQFEPENDVKVTFDKLRGFEKQLNRLVEFCQNHAAKSFSAQDVLDGVVYTIRFGGKIWSLFCPDMSKDPEIVELERLLEDLFGKLEKKV